MFPNLDNLSFNPDPNREMTDGGKIPKGQALPIL